MEEAQAPGHVFPEVADGHVEWNVHPAETVQKNWHDEAIGWPRDKYLQTKLQCRHWPRR